MDQTTITIFYNLFFRILLSTTLLINSAYSSECNEELDIAFIIDSSLSVRENNRPGEEDNWKLIKDFVTKTVSQVTIGPNQIRIAIVHFSSDVHVEQVLTLEQGISQENVIARVNELDYLGGNTNTAAALQYITNNIFNGDKGDRSYVRNIGIILTDGLSNVDVKQTATQAVRTKNQGIDLFAIGVTEVADTAELQEIASDPLGFYYLHVDFYDQLNGVVDQLLGRICIARPPPRLPCKNSRIDLAIPMDESGSITDKDPEGAPENYNWDKMKGFVASIVESLNVGQDYARISVTKFSDLSRVQFLLSDYDNNDDVVNAIFNFDYKSGATNISGALRVLRTEIFRQDAGDRPDVQNIGILITDGESTVEAGYVYQEAEMLRAVGVRMFSLGITNQVTFNELQAIASDPTEEHVFQTEQIQDVNELTNVLVWGVCNEEPTCSGGNCDKPGATRCVNPDSFGWLHFSNSLLLGHNHARLQSVDSADQCKALCLRERNCRSVDYIEFAKECSISFVTRGQQSMDFAASTDADYYEWICEGEDYQPFYVDLTNGSPGDGRPNPRPGNSNTDSKSSNGGTMSKTGKYSTAMLFVLSYITLKCAFI